jgi:hypothetical protein
MFAIFNTKICLLCKHCRCVHNQSLYYISLLVISSNKNVNAVCISQSNYAIILYITNTVFGKQTVGGVVVDDDDDDDGVGLRLSSAATNGRLHASETDWLVGRYTGR